MCSHETSVTTVHGFSAALREMATAAIDPLEV
jgi:hypothetical protein